MTDTNSGRLPSREIIQETVIAIKDRGIDVIRVEGKGQALEKVKGLIPVGASVMNGSSVTLQEIGFTDYLASGEQAWQNLHARILAESEEHERGNLRRKALTADYFLGSVNAIAQTGELVAADASGSRIGAYAYAAAKVILVSGVNKIVPTLEDAIQRIREYVLPLESKRVREVYGMPGSFVGKLLVIEREIVKGRIVLILVNEKLGF